MQKLTPLQQRLLDQRRRYLSRAEQRRIAQAKLFAAALPTYPKTPVLDRLCGVNRKALMRPAVTALGYLTAAAVGRSHITALIKAIDSHDA